MPKQYLQHPLSAAYPSMTEDEFRGLVEDMRRHGQRDVATLYDGMVLDGWHRYSACLQIGIPCRFADFSGPGNDPVAFVISKNTHRRQLSASQRAAAVVAVHAWRPADVSGTATNRGTGDGPSPVTRTATVAQMAAEAGTNERTIQRAKKANVAGLGDAVRDGKVSAERAAEIAKLPKPDQEAALADPTIKPESKALISPLTVVKGGKDATEIEAARARIAELEAENEAIREASEGLQAENEKLCALVDLESEPAKLIADLQKRLVRAQTTLRAAEIQRDNFQRENVQLKSEVKRLRRTAA